MDNKTYTLFFTRSVGDHNDGQMATREEIEERIALIRAFVGYAGHEDNCDLQMIERTLLWVLGERPPRFENDALGHRCAGEDIMDITIAARRQAPKGVKIYHEVKGEIVPFSK